MKKRVIALLLATFIIGAFSGCSNDKKKENNKEMSSVQENYIPVQVEDAKVDTIFQQTVLSGSIISDKNIDVAPKISGKVESINLKVGQEVSEGEVLFTLDKKDIQNKVDQAKAGIESASAALDAAKAGESISNKGIESAKVGLNTAKAALNTAKANYNLNYEKIENAKTNFERVKKLYEEGIVSKAEYEQAKLGASDSSIEVLKAQLNQAQASYSQALKSFEQTQTGTAQSKASIKQAQAGYNQAQVSYNQAVKALDDASVKSPVSGVISSVNIETGEMASNMQPSLTIVSMNKVYVKIDVTENLVNKIKKREELEISLPSIEKGEYKGKVYSISPTANAKTQLYTVCIELNNKNYVLKPGMFASVKVNTNVKKNVIVVKSEAIVQKNEKYIVYVVNGKKALEKEVTVGIDNGEYAEIIKGLNKNDKVIVKGQNYVENNSVVKIVRGDK